MKAIRRIHFCAGHRVYDHESKCAHPHGHNYVAFFYAEKLDTPLDSIGRVMDFSVIKEKIKTWIDKYLDHGFILYKKDYALIKNFTESGYKIYIMDKNPTAENIAKHLIDDILPQLFKNTQIEITKIRLWETENCYVEVFSN